MGMTTAVGDSWKEEFPVAKKKATKAVKKAAAPKKAAKKKAAPKKKATKKKA